MLSVANFFINHGFELFKKLRGLGGLGGSNKLRALGGFLSVLRG
jgi:hypothetical protein